MLIMPTAKSHVTETRLSGVRVRSYASTILFVIAISLSKMPIVIWLYRLELARVYRVGVITIGGAILAFMLASTTTVIFQCEMPNPWDMQMGRCISTRSIWTILIVIDITLDIVLIAVPVIVVTSLGVEQRREIWTSLGLSLRTLLVIASVIRLVYLHQPGLGDFDPVLESLPYTIAAQCQVVMAAVLAYASVLPCLASLVKVPPSNLQAILNKHWSGSSIGSDIATDYFASAPSTPMQEPLSVIQASMATPANPCFCSPHSSIGSLASPGKLAPARPPPPPAAQRPDMSMFTHRPTVRRPPPVTLLRASSGDPPVGAYREQGSVRLSRHVRFVV
ncbi:uncharacterized protein M421DRAFT_307115 [Didymella exigua CBS 183.55]|uniref:Rhodopsin domain-containing protein n=1 Tax=Didymella exigua CBS 183.55 TaxID=1150837 RepID=A0A6A5R8L3_9PLEO|nr:uncharacterized protein M421DRAFT_307115 [Didymella exigua CBS 183.55]KAF1923659.1 hypothetical protein M421DRAFT_307115 [Didymella exigua CBS 183.55]